MGLISPVASVPGSIPHFLLPHGIVRESVGVPLPSATGSQARRLTGS